jgi:hypothetical protein
VSPDPPRLPGIAVVLAVLLALAPCAGAQETGCEGITAEGFGAGAVGGRTVYRVTTTADSGPGSLRDAVSVPGRCIVFDVAGDILLGDHLWVRQPYLTIDGFTAPAPGITLVGRGLVIRGPRDAPPGTPPEEGGHDVIVRGLRIEDSYEDNLQIAYGAYNIVIDHVSSRGALDGELDITYDSHDVTVSWSIFGPGTKAMLIKYGASRVTLHHNLFAFNGSRSPAAAGDDLGTPAADTTVDMRNNVVWQWHAGSGTSVHHGAQANVVANLYASPGSKASDQARALVVCPSVVCPWADDISAAWAHTAENVSADTPAVPVNAAGNVAGPFPAPALTTEPACAAVEQVLAGAGVRPLDADDAATIASVRAPACTTTTTDLVSSLPSAGFGEPVTFTATVGVVSPGVGPVDGTVRFLAGQTLLGTAPVVDGAASLTTAALPAGTHAIVAEYEGDGWLDPSASAALTQVVRGAIPSAATLTATANPTPAGQPVTLTATVESLVPGTGPATGSVRLEDGGTPLATLPLVAGTVALTTSTLPAGVRTVVAAYEGDETFEPSVSPALLLTVRGETTVAVAASPAPARTGQPVVLTAGVAAVGPATATPAGIVAFRAGSITLARVPLVAGAATFTTATLAVGDHKITAAYEGEAAFAARVSTVFALRVLKGETTTTLTSTDPTTLAGEPVQLTATVAPTWPATGVPGGSVTFKDGSKALATVPLAGGVATLATSQLPVGTRSLKAVYGGDARFLASTSAVLTQTVEAAATVALHSSVNPARAGQPVTFSAVVQGPGATGPVTFKDGAKVLGSSSLVNGVATFTASTLTVGKHSITAACAGVSSAVLAQKVVMGATTTVVTASDDRAAPGQAVTLTAVVRAVAPAAGTPTGTVRFLSDGNGLGRTSLVGGVARLTTTALALGRHVITAVYGGDARFEKSTSPSLMVDIVLD